jgi:hypothetical protein
MLTAVIGEHDYVYPYVELPVALFIIEIAKRAEDREAWFPHGKWATIQSMQSVIDAAIDTLVSPQVAMGTPTDGSEKE